MYSLINGLYLPTKESATKNDGKFDAKVLIRRNSDGKVVEYTKDAAKNTTIYQWTEGNFGCDCNRHFFFGKDDDNCSCGETQYSVQIYDANTKELLWDEFEIREQYY